MSQQDEVTQELAISPEDCKAILDFFTHFEIPMPDYLTLAVDHFNTEPSVLNQNQLKFKLCQAMVESKHEAFEDEIFKKIIVECQNVVYKMAFDENLEKVLSGEEAAAAAASVQTAENS